MSGDCAGSDDDVSPALLNACSIEALRHMRDALQTYAEWCGGVHDDLCPEDDTCDCSVKWVNDGVNSAVRFLEGLENLQVVLEKLRELSAEDYRMAAEFDAKCDQSGNAFAFMKSGRVRKEAADMLEAALRSLASPQAEQTKEQDPT